MRSWPTRSLQSQRRGWTLRDASPRHSFGRPRGTSLGAQPLFVLGENPSLRNSVTPRGSLLALTSNETLGSAAVGRTRMAAEPSTEPALDRRLPVAELPVDVRAHFRPRTSGRRPRHGRGMHQPPWCRRPSRCVRWFFGVESQTVVTPELLPVYAVAVSSSEIPRFPRSSYRPLIIRGFPRRDPARVLMRGATPPGRTRRGGPRCR